MPNIAAANTAVKPVEHVSMPTVEKPTISLQHAFENLDINHVISLLEQGADPYQTVEINMQMAQALIKAEGAAQYDRQELINAFKQAELDDSEDFIDLDQLPPIYEETINELKAVKERLAEDESSVSDDELMTLSAKLSQLDIYAGELPESFPTFPVMGIALLLKNIPLMEALIKAGFDFTDPDTMNSLIGHRYQVLLLDPETGDVEDRVVVECPAGEQQNVKESIEELFEGEEYAELLNLLNERREEGSVLQLIHEQSSLFGIVDVMNIEEIIETQTPLIDFLIEQKVSPANLMRFTETFYDDLNLVDHPKEVVDFLIQRGFAVPQNLQFDEDGMIIQDDDLDDQDLDEAAAWQAV